MTTKIKQSWSTPSTVCPITRILTTLAPAGWILARSIIAGGLFAVTLASAQTLAQQAAPSQTDVSPSAASSQLIQRAQTVRIPIQAFSQLDTSPIKDLQPSDFTLDVDSKPQSFQLSRPWANTINAKTGQAEDQPNMLIILPLAGPLDRNDIINATIAALKATPPSGWNISILDDSGDQTAYTRQLPMVIDELEKIGAETPPPSDLLAWRETAATAIAGMRDLPGRRVVLSLGDLFHEVVFQGVDLVYENFEIRDVSTAARAAGVVLYSAEGSRDINTLRRLSPAYSTLGPGPWMLLGEGNTLDGWISNSVPDTLQQIRRDGMAAYDIGLHLDTKQMDGLPHTLSITPRRQNILIDAPTFYAAPSLAQLQELAKGSAALRHALTDPSSDSTAPLQLAAQVEYFPHPDGKTGTQIISTGLFWTPTTPPPSPLELAQQLQQIDTGLMVGTIVRNLDWSSQEPVWNTAMEVSAGAYRLRVAAANPTGKITSSLTTDFSVAPTDPEETVRISSLVIGRSCVFSPPTDETSDPQTQPQPAPSKTVDYLRAGDCRLQPEPSHAFSPQDVLWTLVRITPVAKLAGRPSKDWKGSFALFDQKGARLAESPVRWLDAEDGSFVGTTAFQLGDPKLKLVDGAYAVVLTLKGPGIESDYSEDAPFVVYGVAGGATAQNAPPQKQHGQR